MPPPDAPPLGVNFVGLAVLLSVGLLAGWAVLTLFTARLLTRPPRRGYAFAVSRGVPGDPAELKVPGRPPAKFTSWSVRSRGLDLPVWDVGGDDPDGPIVVLLHGWGESRVHSLSRLPALLAAASRVVLLEFPGHGDAPGRCGLGGPEVVDAGALVDTLHAGDASRPIVAMGFSLGAGVALALASRDARVAGVVAEAPYRLPVTPARNVLASRGLPFRSNLGPALALAAPSPGGFDRAAHAARMRSPLLVLHAEADPIVPLKDARAIAAAAGERGSIVVLPGSGHGTLWSDPSAYPTAAAAVDAFLRRCTHRRPAP
jgi:pimeloyl-ACP methyl ester carboxylesterase